MFFCGRPIPQSISRNAKFFLVLPWVLLPAFGHGRIPPPSAEEEAILEALDATTPSSDLLKHIGSNRYHPALKAALLLADKKEAVSDLLQIVQRPLTLETRTSAFAALVALCRLSGPQADDAVKLHAAEVVRAFLSELAPASQEQQLVNEVKEAYCRAVTRGLGPDQKAEALASRLDTMGDWVRPAIVALGEAALPTLTAKAGDPKESGALRVQAIRCLAAIKSPKAIPLLSRLVESEAGDPLLAGSDQLVGESAAALLSLDAANGLPKVLASFARHKAWLTRLYIVRALGEVKDDSTRRWLEQVAEDARFTADTQAPKQADERAKAVRDHAALAAARIECQLEGGDATAALLRLLKRPHPWVRAFAAQALSGVQDGRVLEPAIEALGDADDNVRRFAIEILANLSDTRAVEALEGVLGGPHEGDRIPAKLALEARGMIVVPARGEFRMIDPQDPLFAQLLDEALPVEERRRSLEELARRGTDGGILIAAALHSPDLQRQTAGQKILEGLTGLTQDPDADLASMAIAALGGAGPAAIHPLLQCLRTQESPRLRRQSALALGSSGDAAATAIAAVLNAETNPESAASIPHLFDALVLCGKAGETLVKQFARGPHPSYRREALRALARANSGSDLLDFLTQGLGDADGSVRSAAANILAEMPENEVTQALQAILAKERNERKLAAAARLLAQRQSMEGVVEAASPLATKAKDAAARRDAIAALRLARKPGCVFPLLEATRDPDPPNALEADAALCSFDSEWILQAAGKRSRGELLAASDPKIRALSALLPPDDDLARSRASELFLQWASKCPYPAMIAHGLGHTGGEKAEKYLLGQLQHRSPVVRRAAARALGQIGSKMAIEPLKALIGDEQPTVSLAARKAIERIQSR